MLGRAVARRLSGVWSDDVLETCSACDAMVVNLECCISDRGEPTGLIRDKPFFFRSPPTGVEALRAIGTTVAGMANNHALDYGPEALVDTVGRLREAGIVPVGAGLSVDEARPGRVGQVGETTVGVLAVSDHPSEFAAGGESPGIAYADLRRGMPDWVLDELESLRARADLVLVFPHWGPNMTVRPERRQRHHAAELIESGADAVAGHSAHVFHGIEFVDGRPVLYDLGDALDDYAVDPELRNDLGILALWRPGGEPPIELVGLALDFCHTRLASGAEADWIAGRLTRACEEFGTAVRRTDEARFAIDA